MKRTFNLAEWGINHPSLITFVMIILISVGAWSYTRLGRSEDPPVTLRIMIVQAQWPGATIADTLDHVTERIEKKLQETPDVDYIRSRTLAGEVTIEVTLKETVPPTNVPDIWYQVRKKVNDIRSTLPQGVVGPEFNDEYGDTYPFVYGFTADGFTHRELRDYVESVRSKLLLLQDIDKIDVIGAQDERIYIEFSNRRLASLNLDRTEVIRALQGQNAVTPAGIVRTGDENIHVWVSGPFASEDDLRQTNVVANGRLFRLIDIGTVTRRYADPMQPLFRVNGKPAVGLAISMRRGGDVISLGRSIKEAMVPVTAKLPIGIEPSLVSDQATVVSHAVGEFLTSFVEALVIVIAISLLSLGLRAGTVIALSIPLVLAVVFAFMDFNAIALQRVSLGALVLALGLLVDDAMITVETMIRKLEEGWDRTKAATYAYMTTHFPMGTGTLVIVLAFLPIGLARSAQGEYLFSLSAVVAVALIVSWLVAALFTPVIGTVLLSVKTNRHIDRQLGSVMRVFRKILVLSMRWRWVTVTLTVAIFAASIFGLGFVPKQFFPASDRPELLVELTLPQNASIAATEKAASEFDQWLRNDPDIEGWSTYVGQGAVRFYLAMIAYLPTNSLAQVVVVTKSLDARKRVQARLERALDERLPEIVGRVHPLDTGMPSEWPIQYRVSGPEIDEVRKIGYRIASLMAQSAEIRNLNFNGSESGKTLQVKVDQDRARLLNLSSARLAEALDNALSGVTITQMRDGTYLIDVVARTEEQERLSLNNLVLLPIPLPNGQTVPLIQVASVGYGQQPSVIRRRNRVPTLTVQSDVAPGVQAETAVSNLQASIAALDASLPAGYKIELGGVAEQSVKAKYALAVELPLMLILLTSALMIQLHSFQRLFLVVSVAPLGLIGTVTALLASGKPLGFVAIVGVISLIGLDVRNSVILMSQIDAEIAQGRNSWDAVIEATVHRFRPILLTASAAALGMIPIATTVFWSPFAFAVIGGLLVATSLTLLFLPALYVLWFRVEEPLTQEIPQAELVPA